MSTDYPLLQPPSRKASAPTLTEAAVEHEIARLKEWAEGGKFAVNAGSVRSGCCNADVDTLGPPLCVRCNGKLTAYDYQPYPGQHLPNHNDRCLMRACGFENIEGKTCKLREGHEGMHTDLEAPFHQAKKP